MNELALHYVQYAVTNVCRALRNSISITFYIQDALQYAPMLRDFELAWTWMQLPFASIFRACIAFTHSSLITAAVFVRWKGSPTRSLPSHPTRPPCPQCRSPQRRSPVSLVVLCGEREPTAGLPKTSIVSPLLYTTCVVFFPRLLLCHVSSTKM